MEEIVLKNAQIIDTLKEEIYRSDVAINKGVITGIGNYRGKEEIDLKSRYLLPGLMDAHVHLESSMVTPGEYAKAVVPQGTTTVIADPHEIANVLGLDGIRYIMDSSENLPLEVFIMLPSCVPATEFETSGARLEAEDLKQLIDHPRVLGLGEVMNFPGVINEDPRILEKIALFKNRIIDGHAPGLSGEDLKRYIRAGIGSDHECTRKEEAEEKLRAGMTIMIREGSASKNLKDLIPIVNNETYKKCLLCTDDRNPIDLLEEGHINFLIKRAISLGLEPLRAIQMATINTARYFRLKDRGAIAPGYKADLVAVDDLENFKVEMVFKDGELVAKEGRLLSPVKEEKNPLVTKTFHVKPLKKEDFRIKETPSRIIGIIPNEIVTQSLDERVKIRNGFAVSDITRDILKIAVVERHKKTGNIGLGFIKGLGLKEGALGTSVAHDSHNIVVVGTDDRDMLLVSQEIIKMQGGLVICNAGRILDSLPLPIAGIMSDQNLTSVRTKLGELHSIASSLGIKLKEPFMTLSFLALAVVPELKITDKGLIDVKRGVRI
ncbi:adenine deaminase [bacterium]|nr:adenine deaminase [bacterium]